MTEKTLDVAYFSMEIALRADIPNYAGGLGVLAGDVLKSCSDLGQDVAGVSLIYHQSDDPKSAFDPSAFMQKLSETVNVRIEDRNVEVGVWQYDIEGKGGHKIPIYFLTTDRPANKTWDCKITQNLYASEAYYRLCQEAILGIGGVRMLRKLGYENIGTFHLNEGHSSFLTLERLREEEGDHDGVKNSCSFTTHTPVEAGHDYFDYPLVYQVLEDMIPQNIREIATEKRFSMTHLALNLSGKTNSVSKRHQKVCQDMSPNYEFLNITNGIHHPSWIAPPMRTLFDEYLPGWEDDYRIFEKSEEALPSDKLLFAHRKSKRALLEFVNEHEGFFPYEGEMKADDYFEPNKLTLVFARRFVEYKRPTLIFHDIEKLCPEGSERMQIIFSGHCHPDDTVCANIKLQLMDFAKELRGRIRIAVTPDYHLDLAKKLVAGTDIWLNTPVPPYEASGTSGMKAALNGGLNLSVLDGWWIEGFAKNPNAGWGFGEDVDCGDPKLCSIDHSESLYESIREAVEAYESDCEVWAKRMKASISLLSRFTTHRAVQEYGEKMWNKS